MKVYVSENHVITGLEAYLRGKAIWPAVLDWKQTGVVLMKDASRLDYLVQQIQLALTGSEQKMTLIRNVDVVLQKYKTHQDLNVRERVHQFKNKLREDHQGNWKDALLHASYQRILGAIGFVSNESISAHVPILLDTKRMQKFSGMDTQQCAALNGTTFFSNEPAVMARNNTDFKLMGTLTLDACYCARVLDGDSIIGAVADGLGGHTGDKNEDSNISRAAYFAVKHAVRLLATFGNPDDLASQSHKIVQEIGAEIKHKLKGSGESVTLTCFRTYRNKDMLRVIGINVGDGMLAAWHGTSGQFQTLLPGRQLIQRMGQGPAHLPGNYDPACDIDNIDLILPLDTVLMPMTDGIAELFPLIHQQKIEHGKNYELTLFNDVEMSATLKHISRGDCPNEIIDALHKEIIRRVETRRVQLLEQSDIATKQLAEMKKNDIDGLALSNEKTEIDLAYENLYKMKGQNTTDATLISEMRLSLDQKKLKWRERQEEYAMKRSNLQASEAIRDGDDLTIMAIQYPCQKKSLL